MADLVCSESGIKLVQEQLSRLAQEAREPSLNLAPLLTEVALKSSSPLRLVPVGGATFASDVAEGAEGQEVELDLGQALWSAGQKKSAVVVKATDEQLRADSIGIMRRVAQAAGRALKRRKEARISEAVFQYGNLLIDNSVATAKSTTGRGSTGTHNGTPSIDDLQQMIDDMIAVGFVPNTLVINPAALKWFRMPSWREWWNLGDATATKTTGTNAWTVSTIPAGMPVEWTIHINPHIPVDRASGTTDFFLAARDYIGELFVDYGIKTEDWKDPRRDLTKTKFSERYGVNIANDGLGIGVAKNVSTDVAFDFAQNTTHNLTGLGSALTGDPGFSGAI